MTRVINEQKADAYAVMAGAVQRNLPADKVFRVGGVCVSDRNLRNSFVYIASCIEVTCATECIADAIRCVNLNTPDLFADYEIDVLGKDVWAGMTGGQLKNLALRVSE